MFTCLFIAVDDNEFSDVSPEKGHHQVNVIVSVVMYGGALGDGI